MRQTQNNFCMGELSPRTYGRFDQPWFAAGCRILENFIALPQGPAVARPGTIREATLRDSSQKHRVESIITKDRRKVIYLISETTIEFYEVVEDEDISVIPVTNNSGDIPLLELDYSNISLDDIQILQHEGQIYLVHPEKQTKVITVELSTGVINQTNFSPYYNTYNDDDKAIYAVNDIVEYEGNQFICTEASPSAAPQAVGDFYSKITYISNLKYSISDFETYNAGNSYNYRGLSIRNGSVWRVCKAIYATYWKTYTDNQETVESTEVYAYVFYSGSHSSIPIAHITNRTMYVDFDGRHYTMEYERPVFTDLNDSLIYVYPNDLDANRMVSPGADLEWIEVAELPEGISSVKAYDAADTTGYAIGDYVVMEGYIYICTITTGANPAAPGESASDDWDYVGIAPSFTTKGEFPNCMIFHDGRLWILGTENNPNVAMASQIYDYTNFTMGPNDSDAIQINLQISGSRRINWATSLDWILIGTDKAELIITGAGEAITPSNFQAYVQSRSGSMRNGVANMGSATCFFQAGGYRLLQFVYSNDKQAYQTPDMGMLGEHLLSVGVKSYSLQTNPDFILWCVMADGSLLGGTFLASENTFGWHTHTTDGEFESVEVVRGNSEDIIFVTVKRPITWDNDGNPTAYIRQLERFAPRRQALDENMVFMDDAEILTVTAEQEAVVSEDKRGMTLTCLQGGAAHKNVEADPITGKIQLSYSPDISGFDKCVVGRAYYPQLSPQQFIPGGTRLDMGIRISRASVKFLESLGVEIGITDGETDPFSFRETTGVLGERVLPFTGERTMTLQHSYGDDEWIVIKRTRPFPCTVLAITYDLDVGGI